MGTLIDRYDSGPLKSLPGLEEFQIKFISVGSQHITARTEYLSKLSDNAELARSPLRELKPRNLNDGSRSGAAFEFGSHLFVDSLDSRRGNPIRTVNQSRRCPWHRRTSFGQPRGRNPSGALRRVPVRAHRTYCCVVVCKCGAGGSR